MIPLATHSLNNWKWYEDIDIINWCNKIRQLIQQYNLRVSMHPDQFVVVNSINLDVVTNSITNLEYHNKLSNLLGNKILILHVGGVSGNKQAAIQRFIDNFKQLHKDIQNKIVLENDDKSFNVEDVLYICQQLNVPMVLDIHHDRCLLSSKPITSLMNEIINTWRDNTPKCHLSSGRDAINDRSHAGYVTIKDYEYALELTKGKFDIMFEAKEKELALLNIMQEV
jgi:UV DNA damage endonuclease